MRGRLPSDRHVWTKWFWSDWRADEAVGSCSFAARGFWMECLALMAKSPRPGHLLICGAPPTPKDLARQTRGTQAEVKRLLDELTRHGVCSWTDDKILFSRRMVRDAERSARNAENGQHGGHPNIRRGTVDKSDRVRPYRKSDSLEKTRRIFDRSSGRCYWCGIALVTDCDPASDAPLNLFHVDHVVAVCDGGTNDEWNLVAACRTCNGARAMKGVRLQPHPDFISVSVGLQSDSNTDTKPHIPEARSQKDQEPDLHTRPKAAKTPRPRRDEPEEFSRFWSAYPRHAKRPNAVRAWIAQQPDLGKVLEALSWQTQQPDWTKQGGRFVPYPASWLNARQWEDEPFHTPAFEDESEAFARVARGEGKL